MSGELIRVPFYGDELEACERGGRILVSLRRVCESIGVDAEGQRKKLKAKSWACTEEMSVQMEGSNQKRLVTLIDRKCLSMWLATIDERKVKPELKDKLIRYQKECADVLDAHFRKVSNPDPILAQAEMVIALRHSQIEQERKLAEVEQKANIALQQATAAQQTAECNYGWYSVLAYCNRVGRRVAITEAGRVGKELTAKLKALGSEPRRVSDPRFGFVNLYPESLLEEHFGGNGQFVAA